MTYNPGFLRDFQIVAESQYGVIPTGTMTWAGDIQSYDPMVDMQVERHILPGDRGYNTVTRKLYQCGARVRYLDRVGSEWHDIIAAYGYGSASGLAATLPDFTMQVNKYDGTNNNWYFHNGCKINEAKISCEQPGAKLEFDLDVFCQWIQIVTHASSKQISSQMQDVTPGADASDETGATLCWSGASQINLAAGGLADWWPLSWSLTVRNHLVRVPGFKTGDDAVNYPVCVGLDEGIREIVFEAEVLSRDEVYAKSKKAFEAITALTIPIDNETITLSNGSWDEPSLGSFAQGNDSNRERIAIQFPQSGLSIA